jgi:predicted O-linked N-acetylglucosamine transferase (SPINDLY family)/SAM-dependent methyltransferase
VNPLYSSWHYSPAAIASAAWLYNFTCAEQARATVLDIGCGSGESLLCHASAYPESTCVGVDIDPERINAAMTAADELGLNNIHFYCLGIGDLLSLDVGKFDYIILPRLYSLLDEETREALLSWCSNQLSESGLIAVKWNVLPGARANTLFHQAIAFHTRDAQTEQGWLSSARAILTFMEMVDGEGEIKRQAQQALQMSDAELMAQYLEQSNDACLLSEFTARVEASGLRLIGDVVPQYEIARHYSEHVHQLQRVINPGKSRLEAQQYLDFAVQRSERFSLLISALSPQPVCDNPELEKIDTLHWAAYYGLTDDENQRLTRGGDKVVTATPEVRSLLDWMGAAWPRSLSTEQLIQLTLEPEKPEQHREKMLRALRELYLSKPPMLYVASAPSPYNLQRNKPLRAVCSFSESEVASGEYCLRSNWWGERVTFRLPEWALCKNGFALRSTQDVRTAIELAGKGLISGSAPAWVTLWQAVMANGDRPQLEACLKTYLVTIGPPSLGGQLTAAEERAIVNQKPRETLPVKQGHALEALLKSGMIQQAKAQISELLPAHGRDGRFLMLAANACRHGGDFDMALMLQGKRLGLGGDYPQALWLIAQIFGQQESRSQSAKLLSQYLIKRTPGRSRGWQCLSGYYKVMDELKLEEHCLRRSIELDEKNSTSLLSLAILFSHTGRFSEAISLCRQVLAQPDSAVSLVTAQGMYVFLLSHDDKMPAAEKFQQHREYGRLVTEWGQKLSYPTPSARQNPQRKTLRVGFVSGDLNNHPVHSFIYPVWKSLNRQRYELYAYATGREDAISELYRESATSYLHVGGMGEQETAARIAADEIDILVDLSGFTAGHRLPVFALKPAPVQMSWIGFVGSTGLPQMDYYLMPDGLAQPGELDGVFCEKLISLPSAKLFEYSARAPAVNALPALKNGYLTLGSFNRPQKLTPTLLDCWASILRELPHARMLMGFMADEAMMEHYAQQMTRRGVAREQLEFRTKQNFADYMALHHEVDILLDSHPYSAGTTAQHAIWMGVPLVTTIETSAVSRTSALAMRLIGLEAFVTTSLEDYARKVIELDGRRDYLNALRQGMRQRIIRREQSHSHNAYYFEKMLEAVWQRHLSGEPPSALVIEDEHRWSDGDAE